MGEGGGGWGDERGGYDYGYDYGYGYGYGCGCDCGYGCGSGAYLGRAQEACDDVLCEREAAVREQ